MAPRHRIRKLLLGDLNEDYFSLLCELSGDNQPLTKKIIKSCWDNYIDNLDHCTFVCEDTPKQLNLGEYLPINRSGTIIGTASVLIEHKMLHYGSKVGHIEDVVVSSNAWRLGIGNALIQKCIDFCRDSRCYKIILDCSDKNISFYERCGFKLIENCMRIDLKYDS